MSGQRTLTRFARIILTMGSGESGWLILAFILGALALGVLSNLIFTVVSNPASVTYGALFRTGLCVGLMVILAFAAYNLDAETAPGRRAVAVTIDEKRAARPSRGLVWLISFGSVDLPLVAIAHHSAAPPEAKLRHCWVLLTPDAEQAGMCRRLETRLKELGYDLTLHEVSLQSDNAEETHRAVVRVYDQLAKRPGIGLTDAEITCDITGGNKQMTTGMVVACLHRGWSLEYVVSQRDPETGEIHRDSQTVVQVSVDFSA